MMEDVDVYSSLVLVSTTGGIAGSTRGTASADCTGFSMSSGTDTGKGMKSSSRSILLPKFEQTIVSRPHHS